MIFPVRGLHANGIMHDPSPTSLDLNAWSGGMNVRMHQNYAERAPVWRTMFSPVTVDQPAFCTGVHTSLGDDWILVAGPTERLWRVTPGAFAEVTPAAGWSSVTASAAFTTCQLGNVVYINRPSQPPFYYGPSSAAFAVLPGWDPTWTCRSLRSYGNYLVALNVTKGASAFPNLVKTSDLTLFGQPPGSWDQTNLTTSATENPLEHLTTPIVDGGPLRDGFVIYTSNQIWLMEQTDTTQVFRYSQLFGEGGEIAPNCHVEVDGVHYVFGPTDIYEHDGTNKGSIIDGRNRHYVFDKLVTGQTEACFAAYLPQFDSILFAYPTTNPEAALQGTTYCNQGGVYDRNTKTWSFIDLANVSAVTIAYGATAATWATWADTWATATATWTTLAGTPLGLVVGSSALSSPLTASRLLVYDFADKGLFTQMPVEAEVNPSAYLLRTGIDLDQLGGNIVTYKLLKRIFPLLRTYGGAPMQVQVGSQQTVQGAVSWAPAVTFDPTLKSKVDVLKGGKFLALQFTMPTLHDFELAGFDADVGSNGRRG